jgi:iron-sulfur cluster assembly protein
MDAEIITLTDKAQSYLSNLMTSQESNTDGVRVCVIGGGCSGLSYKIDFGAQKEKDRVLNFQNGLTVYIDPKSSIYLKGVVLDYEDGLNGKGFVFKNPNATNTCGCGESFSV